MTMQKYIPGVGNVDMTEEEEAAARAKLLPMPVPQIISDRQFFQALALQGLITQEEALSAVKTGDIPAAIQTFVDTIGDETEKFTATMLLSGAVEFDRSHALTGAFGAAGWSAEQIDDLWRFASTL